MTSTNINNSGQFWLFKHLLDNNITIGVGWILFRDGPKLKIVKLKMIKKDKQCQTKKFNGRIYFYSYSAYAYYIF